MPIATITAGVPAVWSAEPAADRPLVVCLHGFTADEADIFAITDRLGERPVFVAPRAPIRAPAPLPGYAWFPLAIGPDGSLLGAGDTPADRAAAAAIATGAAAAADGLLAWLDAIIADGPTPSSLGLVGFSQGGIVAAQALRRQPERVAATVLFSSMIAPGDEPRDAELAAARPPLLFGWGGADPVIPAAATAHARAWAAAHTGVVEVPEPALGHELSNAQLAAAATFLATHLA